MRPILSVLMTTALLAACGGADDDMTPADSLAVDTGAMNTMERPATAVLRDASGRELGTVTLAQSDSGIQLSGRLEGLSTGERGIHLHSVGSCSPDFAAAGDHWNPTNRQHGTDNSEGPHMGDLVNLQVNPDSTATINAMTPGGQLTELIDGDGASVVVHMSRDDYTTDPDGGSGERVACGVVTQ